MKNKIWICTECEEEKQDNFQFNFGFQNNVENVQKYRNEI